MSAARVAVKRPPLVLTPAPAATAAAPSKKSKASWTCDTEDCGEVVDGRLDTCPVCVQGVRPGWDDGAGILNQDPAPEPEKSPDEDGPSRKKQKPTEPTSATAAAAASSSSSSVDVDASMVPESPPPLQDDKKADVTPATGNGNGSLMVWKPSAEDSMFARLALQNKSDDPHHLLNYKPENFITEFKTATINGKQSQFLMTRSTVSSNSFRPVYFTTPLFRIGAKTRINIAGDYAGAPENNTQKYPAKYPQNDIKSAHRVLVCSSAGWNPECLDSKKRDVNYNPMCDALRADFERQVSDLYETYPPLIEMREKTLKDPMFTSHWNGKITEAEAHNKAAKLKNEPLVSVPTKGTPAGKSFVVSALVDKIPSALWMGKDTAPDSDGVTRPTQIFFKNHAWTTRPEFGKQDRAVAPACFIPIELVDKRRLIEHVATWH